MRKENGALDICIDDQYSGRQISWEEWSDLFYKVLGVPRESYSEGEPYVQFDNRQDALFQEDMRKKGFPMLGRIVDIYKDVKFSSSETEQLLTECELLLRTTKSTSGRNALENLVFAGGEARKKGCGLILICD